MSVAYATELEGSRPWDVDNRTLPDNAEWCGFLAPAWVRQAVVKNTHATDPLYLGKRGAGGVVDLEADKNTPLAAGESIVLTLSEGRSRAHEDARRIPLHSPTADHPFSVVMVAWSAS